MLYLSRAGTPSVAHVPSVAFKVSRYEDAGTAPRTRFDIGLAYDSGNGGHASSNSGNHVMTLLDNGEVTIPGALVVGGDINSPTLTGIPTAPTAANTTDTDQIATTKFVQERITAIIGGAPAALDTLKEITDALTGADNTAGAITTTITDNTTAITTLQTEVNNLSTSVSGGSTFLNATSYAHYSNPVHIGGSTAPVDTSLQITGNIQASGNITANKTKLDGSNSSYCRILHKDSTDYALSQNELGKTWINSSGHGIMFSEGNDVKACMFSGRLGLNKTSVTSGYSLDVEGNIKMSGIIRQW